MSGVWRPNLHPIYCSPIFNVISKVIPGVFIQLAGEKKRGWRRCVSFFTFSSCKWPSLPASDTLCSYVIGKATGMATPRCKGGWDKWSCFPATVSHYNSKDTCFWRRASSRCHNPLGSSGKNPFIWLVVICATKSSVSINNYLQWVFFSLVWLSFRGKWTLTQIFMSGYRQNF